MAATTKTSKIISATEQKSTTPLPDRKALEFWLTPNNMIGKIHEFDLKVGGSYSMSLFYRDSETAGKTSGKEDRFSSTFVELSPYEKIAQTINFQPDKNEFTGEMIMEVF